MPAAYEPMSPPSNLFPPTSGNGYESAKTDGIIVKNGGSERSRPPTPHGEGLPTNFAQVVQGVYRSSYPLQPHLDALSKLGLKTVITLVDEEYPPGYLDFIHENGIHHLQIPIIANKDPAVYSSEETVVKVLKVILDRAQHPLLIHCNKGKHRTGCIVACFRKVQGWTVSAAITEYTRYSQPKSRALDRNFINAFDENTISELALEVGACHWVPTILPFNDDNNAISDASNNTTPSGESAPPTAFHSNLNELQRSFTT